MPKLSRNSSVTDKVEEYMNQAEILSACNELIRENPATTHLAHSDAEIREIMEEAGIGLRSTIFALASMQKGASSEGNRMRAIEKSLEALGVTGKRDAGEKQGGVVINVHTNSANLQSIYNPQRTN